MNCDFCEFCKKRSEIGVECSNEQLKEDSKSNMFFSFFLSFLPTANIIVEFQEDCKYYKERRKNEVS